MLGDSKIWKTCIRNPGLFLGRCITYTAYNTKEAWLQYSLQLQPECKHTDKHRSLFGHVCCTLYYSLHQIGQAGQELLEVRFWATSHKLLLISWSAFTLPL